MSGFAAVFVILTDGTTGRLWDGKAVVGAFVTIVLHDENGVEIKKRGMIQEVL